MVSRVLFFFSRRHRANSEACVAKMMILCRSFFRPVSSKKLLPERSCNVWFLL